MAEVYRPLTNTEARMKFFRLLSTFYVRAVVLRGIKLLPYSFFRTAEEQRKLFDEKKSNCDGTKVVSPHQLWLAMDFVLIDKSGLADWGDRAEYHILGNIWESLDPGCKWGGNFKTTKFKDLYHFEFKP